MLVKGAAELLWIGGRHPATLIINSEAGHSYDLRVKDNEHLDRSSGVESNDADTRKVAQTNMDMISRLTGLQATNLSSLTMLQKQ